MRRFFSLEWELGCEGVNFFAQGPFDGLLWVNPPFPLLFRVLLHPKKHRADALVCAPQWESAPWWPLLLSMLTAPLLALPCLADTFRPQSTNNTAGRGPPPWPVVVAAVSGDTHKVAQARAVWGERLTDVDFALANAWQRPPGSRRHAVGALVGEAPW